MKNLPTRQQIKDLQKTESPIEKELLEEFHLHGYYPVPQYWIGKYRVDLAFVDEKIVIECDGELWHSNPEQKIYDSNRDLFLESQGWTVFRVSGKNIKNFKDKVIGLLLDKSSKSKFKKYNVIWDLKRELKKIKIDYDCDGYDEIEEKEKRIEEISNQINYLKEDSDLTKLSFKKYET